MKSVYDSKQIAFDFSITRTKFNLFADIGVTLYNPSHETIQAASKKGTVAGVVDPRYNISNIMCEAGYNNNNKVIFSGTVFSIIVEQGATEKTATLKVSNFAPQVAEKVFSYSVAQPPRLSQALADIATKIGAQFFNQITTADDKQISTTSFVGTIREFLAQEATKNPAFTCQINNDQIVLTGSAINENVQFLEELSADTGMILTPVVTDKNMVKVQMPFNPDYVIDAPVKVVSTKFPQSPVVGTIYKYTHNVTVRGGISVLEILPKGQIAPIPNFGVSA